MQDVQIVDWRRLKMDLNALKSLLEPFQEWYKEF